jgi:hypothetical protein
VTQKRGNIDDDDSNNNIHGDHGGKNIPDWRNT